MRPTTNYSKYLGDLEPLAAMRQTVGRIVVPMLFERLPNLRLRDDARPLVRGWVFRGPISLPVRWDA